MEITDQEIQQAWREYRWLIITWNLVSITGFIGFVVIGNFILKNYLGYTGKLATCNDTIDGDFGNLRILLKNRLVPKNNAPKLFKLFIHLDAIIYWWFRNHSWNYLNAEVPEWKGGEVEDFREIECTIPEIDMMEKDVYNPFTKASREDGILGINHYAYRLNGKVFVSYSEATEKREKQFGAGGNEWRCWIKPLF